MANKIIIKNGTTIPKAENLNKAELGFDSVGKKVYIGQETEAPICLNPSEVSIDFEGAAKGTIALTNADSLGGIPAENYATKEYVLQLINTISK